MYPKNYWKNIQNHILYAQIPARSIDICIKKNEKSNLKYMKTVWSGISTQIEDCDNKKEKRKIISKYMDEVNFINFLDRMLNRSLKNFLNIEEKDDTSDESDSDYKSDSDY